MELFNMHGVVQECNALEEDIHVHHHEEQEEDKGENSSDSNSAFISQYSRDPIVARAYANLNDILLPFNLSDEKIIDNPTNQVGLSPSTIVLNPQLDPNYPSIHHIHDKYDIHFHDDDVKVNEFKPLLHPNHHLPPLPPLMPSASSDIQVLDDDVDHPQRHAPKRPPMRKGTPSYREAHIHSERQRRQDMTSLFSTLRSLLPMELHDVKSDRCTILGYVIEYLQDLDQKVQELAKVKADLEGSEGRRKKARSIVESIAKYERQAKNVGHSNLNITVRFWGRMDIFITLNCPKKHGLWPHLLALLQETFQLDVQNVTLSSTPFFCLHSIYAKVMDVEHHQVSCDEIRRTLANFVATYNVNMQHF